MNGKRIVVTGASRGIGRETALGLGKLGARLSFVVRDEDRGRAVAEEIRRSSDGAADVDVFVADLSSMRDVQRVGEELLAKHDTIDVLVNNAGAMLMERSVTVDGFESTFATNHLAYFHLTALLRPALERAPRARIVNVSSDIHYRGTLRFDDLMSERRYSGMAVYAASKLANVLFTTELAKRLEGTNVTTNALHPGLVASGFGRNNGGVVGFFFGVAAPLFLSAANGAKTSLYLATDPAVERTTGKYFAKCAEKKPSREARDASVASRLWNVSEELVEKALRAR